MGLPNHLSLSSWQACRLMVAGRLVNCFSQKDLILSLMFQFKKFGLKPGKHCWYFFVVASSFATFS